jgi:hypothetical protein
MHETFAVGYNEAEGEETMLQIIPLLLEAGQVYIAEELLKNLPASPLKIYHVVVLLRRWVSSTRRRVIKKRQF